MQFLPFIAIGLFFYFILLRPQQAEQRRRKELLTLLKKNDKVVTTGGMIGTIADISSDGTRVTLRVDDNTRIKFLRSAIQEPLKDTTESNGSSAT
ncbi:MAG: preprotein translocase subunit YajC [Planctomycetota bacterium]|nr:MAG: preprotein translocase subunit YajC [Planctomycetota bacterium]